MPLGSLCEALTVKLAAVVAQKEAEAADLAKQITANLGEDGLSLADGQGSPRRLR